MVRNLWSTFGFLLLKQEKDREKREVGKDNGYLFRNADFMKEYWEFENLEMASFKPPVPIQTTLGKSRYPFPSLNAGILNQLS